MGVNVYLLVLFLALTSTASTNMAKTLTRPMFGWDLVYSSHEKSIDKKDDLLILLIHWSLTHKGFKCTDRHTDTVPSESSKIEETSGTTTSLETENIPRPSTGSEVLPESWNSASDGNYVIHYALNDIPFILRSTHLENVVIINLLRCTDNVASSVALQPDKLVIGLNGSIETMIPDYKSVLNMIENKLIMPVHCVSREAETQTVDVQKRDVDSLYRGVDNSRYEQQYYRPNLNLRSIGSSDLDPLGHSLSGGGMIFDPFRRDKSVPLGAGALPQGSVPPGARFDPIGPLNPQPEIPHPLRPGRFQPDPDHLPPPGFDDFLM